jgi:hypothetical protein
VFAIDTKDTAGSAENVKLNVEGIDKKVAGMLVQRLTTFSLTTWSES